MSRFVASVIPEKQPVGRNFQPPNNITGRWDASALSIPPYRTLTHPVVERVLLVGTHLGQAQSWRLRLPQWMP